MVRTWSAGMVWVTPLALSSVMPEAELATMAPVTVVPSRLVTVACSRGRAEAVVGLLAHPAHNTTRIRRIAGNQGIGLTTSLS